MKRENATRIRRWNRLMMLGLACVLAGSVFASTSRGFALPNELPSGPDRYAVSTVDYTKYTYWMIPWGKKDVVCEIVIDHEGLPTPGDIYIDCGESLYDKWVMQQPCKETDVRLCKGYYLVLVDSQPAQKQVTTKLQAPVVQVTLENCNPIYTSSTSICEYAPILVLTGIEPIPGYNITGIEGLYGGQSFSCAPVCRLQLPVTGENVLSLQFWAYSSYGDSSEVFDAQIRVALRDEGNPDQQDYWYVDVLSSQWIGVPVATCVETWGVLPPVGGPPQWLSTPTDSEALGTQIPYSYLSAHLIETGVVDATSCPDGGLMPDGSANACGMEVAEPAVIEWQNQFDEVILSVAKDTGVPANLLKNLFAVESQFWPGTTNKDDVGLGQLTEPGADTSLMWNPPFFKQFCPLVYTSETCAKGYLGLDDDEQELIRQSLLRSVDASCETCPLGVDVDRARFSIGVFAHTLMANCEQASQVVWNYNERKTPEQLGITYEDMWKFTMVNYNAGGGCLASAFAVATEEEELLTFDAVSKHLAPACQGAVEYVNQLSQ